MKTNSIWEDQLRFGEQGRPRYFTLSVWERKKPSAMDEWGCCCSSRTSNKTKTVQVDLLLPFSACITLPFSFLVSSNRTSISFKVELVPLLTLFLTWTQLRLPDLSRATCSRQHPSQSGFLTTSYIHSMDQCCRSTRRNLHAALSVLSHQELRSVAVPCFPNFFA